MKCFASNATTTKSVPNTNNTDRIQRPEVDDLRRVAYLLPISRSTRLLDDEAGYAPLSDIRSDDYTPSNQLAKVLLKNRHLGVQ